MAKAAILIKDVDGEDEPVIEVTFDGKVDNNSAAHQLVAEFIKYANMKPVTN